ncbi:ATP phosphoribosyltransferase regulatory subunit [Nanoarchaeota archaeon]
MKEKRFEKRRGIVPGTYFMLGKASLNRRRIIKNFVDTVTRRGYQMVELPGLWPAGTFVGEVVPDKYRSRVGQIQTEYDEPFANLELGYELTAPVCAMMVALGIEKGRFAYADRVRRFEREAKLGDQGRWIEFSQLGIENLAIDPILGNMETIALWQNFGESFDLDVSTRVASVELFKKILEDNNATKDDRIKLRAIIDKNEIDCISTYLCREGQKPLREQLLQMVSIKGPLFPMVDKMESLFPQYQNTVDQTRTLAQLLDNAGYYEGVTLDQTAQRGLGLYDSFGIQGGIVGVDGAAEVMGGGDYTVNVGDQRRSGSGFGIGLERFEDEIERALDNNTPYQQRILLYGDDPVTLVKAQSQMLQSDVEGLDGENLVVEIFPGDEQDARKYAKQNGIYQVIRK